ncbi:NADPH-dependent oxidoreductase [Photobacterium gaetbulicola]|uniref:Putative oxidoreductase n=1 Tax=Photobacterium gaetbulicola Gung47 TaxID=658445 RepID=A0A0C5WH71_9GAMM|nr:nitroreductase family protein [Photobacterium gaetbulicola]AJR06483.1 putative oxidoreductase [Photobacterium gaetbulicola Gung47]PSU02511.1 NADPH-dependent oxidoreductase [Photobacterium gaetbulicola]
MDILSHLHAHRSIRQYSEQPVSDDVLQQILQAGIRASSSGNMQSYSIIVTKDKGRREALFEPHMQQNMVVDAPVLLTFCADFRRMKKWLAINDAQPNFDNFMSFMIAAIDATLVSQNVAIAAEAKGLGLCYMGSTLANCDKIGEILELPPGVVPVVGYSLGYADEAPDIRDRLPLDGLIHNETYHDHSDEEIKAIYHQRETDGWNRYMSYPELKAKIEASDVKNLAQIYTSLKYTRESHIGFSETVLHYLEKQGFMNHTK